MKKASILFVVICSLLMLSCGKRLVKDSKFNNKPDDRTSTATINFTKNNGDKRLLCYNVRHCKGMDTNIDYSRIATIISTVNPDFVALQEVDSMTNRSNQINQIEKLGKLLNMHSYFGAAIPYQGGKYGVGILSKEPALKTFAYPLPGEEKRVFLIAEYLDFLIISTHLDLKEQNRIESVKLITDVVKKFNKKAFLAGDFNEVELNGALFQEFGKSWTIVSPIKNTFPTSPLPNKCIDFIITFKGVGKYNISKEDVIYQLPNVNVTQASDHYPLYIDFN